MTPIGFLATLGMRKAGVEMFALWEMIALSK
jgi:hypothetical protein